MGRPLNKKFFGDLAGRLAVECWTERAGASTAGYIVRQRSNLIYEIADETLTDVDVDNLTVGSLYEIAVVGTTDFTTAGAASNTVGERFTATAALATGTGTAREIVFGKLQEAGVTAAGQARLPVTPENAQGTVQATVTTTTVGGAGTALDTVVIANAGYGYWTDGTGVSLAAGDGTINYTVDGNGSLATVEVANAGTTNTAGTLAIGDAPATNPPVQYARILNARLVKTFPAVGGSTFAWPVDGGQPDSGAIGVGGFRGGFGEADPDTQ